MTLTCPLLICVIYSNLKSLEFPCYDQDNIYIHPKSSGDCGVSAELGGADDVKVFDPSTLDPNRCESCYGAETEDLK